MIRARRRILLAILLSAGGCAPPAAPAGDTAIARWLTCTECIDRELTQVRALGAGAAPALRRAVDGPSLQTTTNMTRSSADAFVRARRQSERLGIADRALRPLGDSMTFVASNVDNFRAMYQFRAAMALALVDPSGARAFFATKLAQDSLATQKLFRADVRRFVDSLAHTTP